VSEVRKSSIGARKKLIWGRVATILAVSTLMMAIAASYWVRLGWLPGDIYIKKWDVSFYLPLTSSALVGLVMTVFYLILVRTVSQFGYSRSRVKAEFAKNR